MVDEDRPDGPRPKANRRTLATSVRSVSHRPLLPAQTLHMSRFRHLNPTLLRGRRRVVSRCGPEASGGALFSGDRAPAAGQRSPSSSFGLSHRSRRRHRPRDRRPCRLRRCHTRSECQRLGCNYGQPFGADFPGVTRNPVSPPPPSANTVEIAKRVLPATVMIQVDRGTGSGFLIDREGRIVTNNHVVAEAAERIEDSCRLFRWPPAQRRAGGSQPLLRHRGDQGERGSVAAAARAR